MIFQRTNLPIQYSTKRFKSQGFGKIPLNIRTIDII